MEVFFLDVAQGSSQVVLLGGRRAIVIDCGGRSGGTILHFLKRMNIDFLDGLLVSHSHDDHMGGAAAVLGEYRDRIERIGFVQDHQFLESNFWARLADFYSQGVISKKNIVRLELSEQPQPFWSDLTLGAELSVWSPDAMENLQAQIKQDQNPTSAVLVLERDGRRVVFAADSDLSQWREIHRRHGQVDCDAFSVPHHGGRFFGSQQELDWFFDQAISSQVAIISVGTSNTHGHPREEVVKALTKRGTVVACTQFTRQCNGGVYDLEFLRPGVLQPQLHPCQSSGSADLTDRGNSRNLACAGTIKLEFTAGGFVYDRLLDHQRSVDLLKSTGNACPLCR